MNLFELFVKVGVDDQASGKLKDLGGKLGNGLKTAAKIGTAAVGAATAGIIALTKAAVDNYAEYEQLIGGVETLFKDSAGKIQDFADRAYQTAGLSANEYMSTVTGFSASLLQSLGGDTEKAADYADMAITDMADNANKMGTSMELIQNAYQGFAKQNYTMLDNLKLGYGGTKEEMARLIEDAAKLDSSIQANDLSFGNIVKSINAVQKEMGIYGTTAKEASATISGSLAAVKAQWNNLLTAISQGDDWDLGVYISNFVDTVSTAIGNLLPVITKTLNGAAILIRDLIPIIVQEIPALIEENLPILAEAAISIIQSLVDGISQNQGMLMTTAFETITYLATSLISMLPQIVQLGLDLIVSLANGIAESLPVLIPTIVDVILQIVNTLTDPAQLNLILNAGLELLLGLVQGLVDAVPSLIDAAFTIIDNLVQFILDPENLTAVIEASLEIIMKIAEGLIQAIPQLAEAAVQIIVKLCEFILDPENISMLIDMCFDLIIVISEGLLNAAVELVKAAGILIEQLIDVFKKTDWDAVGQSIVDSVSNGYQKSWDVFSDWVSGAWDDIVEAIETTDWEGIGRSIVEFLWNGYLNFWGGFFEWVSNTWDELVDMFESPDWNGLGSSVVDGILGGIQGAWGSLVSWVSNAWNNLIGGLGSMFGIETPAASPEDKLPKAINAARSQTSSSGMTGKMSVATATASGKAGKGGAGVTIVQNIHAVPQTPAELASATSAYFEQARWTR